MTPAKRDSFPLSSNKVNRDYLVKIKKAVVLSRIDPVIILHRIVKSTSVRSLKKYLKRKSFLLS